MFFSAYSDCDQVEHSGIYSFIRWGRMFSTVTRVNQLNISMRAWCSTMMTNRCRQMRYTRQYFMTILTLFISSSTIACLVSASDTNPRTRITNHDPQRIYCYPTVCFYISANLSLLFREASVCHAALCFATRTLYSHLRSGVRNMEH